MNDRSPTCEQLTLPDMLNATSSQGSEDGRLLSRTAGWPDDRPVWTGSCPCQPFSAAGQAGQGFADPRHLWPVWFLLIRECQPPIVFGEQVAGAIKPGWLDAVFTDLEAEGYATGAAVLPACGVGAPHHIRQRAWFVADASGEGLGKSESATDEFNEKRWGHAPRQAALSAEVTLAAWATPRVTNNGNRGSPKRANDGRARLEDQVHGAISTGSPAPIEKRGQLNPAHSRCRVILLMGSGSALEGKSSVGMLRAYGNAIVPQVAAAFIEATMGAIDATKPWNASALTPASA